MQGYVLFGAIARGMMVDWEGKFAFGGGVRVGVSGTTNNSISTLFFPDSLVPKFPSVIVITSAYLRAWHFGTFAMLERYPNIPINNQNAITKQWSPTPAPPENAKDTAS